MNIAMMGLIKGFAQGTSERIDKEREDEEALITNRFKMAAINKKQREEEAGALKEAAKARLDQVNTLFPGASLEQRLALISNETMFSLAVKNADTLADKEKLDSFIVVNKEKIPSTFKTAQDYINSITAKPAGEMKMPEQQSREVFFADVTPSAGRQQKIAQQFGTSAEELYAYEKATGPISASVYGSVNLEALKKPKDLEDQIKEIDLKATDPATSEDERAVLNERKAVLIAQQNFGQDPKTLQEEANRISLKLLKAEGEEKTDLQAQLDKVNKQIRSNSAAQAQEKDRAEKAGDKPLTFAETRRMVESAQVAALEAATGLDAVTKGKLLEEYTDEDGVKRIRQRRVRPTDIPEIASIARKAAIDALKINGHIDANGNLSLHARGVLTGLGLLDAQGRIIPDPLEAKGRQDTENEANRQRGDTPAPSTPQGQKTATMDQVRAIAAKRGKTVDEIKKDMEANGYVITGE